MSNFYAIGANWHNQEGRYIKAWEPGDGVRCSKEGHQRGRSCGKPVAVMVVKYEDSGAWSKWDRKQISYVFCADHLSKTLLANPRNSGPSPKARYEKAATEALVEKHWDEFCELISEVREKEIERAIVNLPEDIKSAVRESLAFEDEYDPREEELNQKLADIQQELEELKRRKSN